PLKVVAPGTMKKIDNNVVLKLPNGTRIRAGDFFDRLNTLEKYLNSVGYSLMRGDKVIVLNRLSEKNPDLEKKGKGLAGQLKGFDPKTMKAEKTGAALAAHFKAGASAGQSALAEARKGLQKGVPGAAPTFKPWSYTLGKKDVVAATVEARLEAK